MCPSILLALSNIRYHISITAALQLVKLMLLEELILLCEITNKSVATREQEPFYLLYHIHYPLSV